MKKDTCKKSALKSILWRAMGVIVLATVVYAFTRSWITTSIITFIHHGTFLLVFYLHERLWFRIKMDNKRLRRILKAIGYEIVLGMGIGGLIVLIVTGQWSTVGKVTLSYTAIKLVMYYFYEKIFNKT